MIRVSRPATAPKHLRTSAAQKTRALCEAVTSGNHDVEVDRAVLKKVKPALEAAQHGKCCYCESKVRSADVEHFRPVKSTRQSVQKSPRKKPGYYWLAYDWQNLLWACRDCNEYCKNDRFPLQNPAARARSPKDDLSTEKPLLIDPATEDPAQHLRFHAEEVLALTPQDRVSRKGRTTVAVLGLSEPSITALRQAHYEEMRRIYEIYQALRASGADPNAEAQLAEVLRDKAKDSAPYAAMARAALTRWSIPWEP